MINQSQTYLNQRTLPLVHPPIRPLTIPTAVDGILAHGTPQQLLPRLGQVLVVPDAIVTANQTAGVWVVGHRERHLKLLCLSFLQKTMASLVRKGPRRSEECSGMLRSVLCGPIAG